jgi:hypothetical protein
MTTDEPWPKRAARILPLYGLSMPDYYLMCTAGYRVTLERQRFIKHAAWAFEGLGWPDVTHEEMASALDHLLEAGLMISLTELDVQSEKERRVSSPVPEVDDAQYYEPGHIEFTERGYLLYREIVREICGDAFLIGCDVGFDLDSESGRFDVYAVTAEGCQQLMDRIEADGDGYTGTKATKFVGKDGPTKIGAWRPIRFRLCAAGFHGVLRYVSAPLLDSER